MRTRRIPPIKCPHCGSFAEVRSSEQVTALIRDVRYRCDDDDCGHSFVATIEIVRTVQPSLQPRPGIILPVLPHRRAANDDTRVPANDDTPDNPAATMT